MKSKGITWDQACDRRLARQFLANPAPANTPVADIVAAMRGAHAQVMSAAELSVGVRATGVTRADVRAALWEERSLIKTYGPRGTVHLLDIRELPLQELWPRRRTVLHLAGQSGAVCCRHLHAYGPAAPRQFAKWLAAVAGDTEFPEGPVRGVRLLPYFDAYGIAAQPRELLFPGRARERAPARGQAGNYPLLLVDGVVAGCGTSGARDGARRSRWSRWGG